MTLKRSLHLILSKLKPSKIVKANIAFLEPNHRLEGKKIIITGGNRGLGFSMAKKFVSEGAEVLIAGRNEEALKESSQEIGCKYLVYDVADISKTELFLKEADLMPGVIDLNNLYSPIVK